MAVSIRFRLQVYGGRRPTQLRVDDIIAHTFVQLATIFVCKPWNATFFSSRSREHTRCPVHFRISDAKKALGEAIHAALEAFTFYGSMNGGIQRLRFVAA
jgi:hypothetical protein